MKKLLAILLTVMLFVGVIPASAFASEEIDLRPAYEAMNTLNNAYAQLGVAVALKNGYDGFLALGNSHILGPKATGEALEEAGEEFAEAAEELLKQVKESKVGVSYEKLFAMVYPVIAETYGDVGEEVVNDVSDAIGVLTTGVTDSAAAIVASVG